MRAFIIVIDGFGIGELPDSRMYNDLGANTLKNLVNSYDIHLPTMESLGLYNIDGVFGNSETSKGAFARLAEISKAKDTTAGHWEIAGIITKEPFPTFPNGFPHPLVEKLRHIFNKDILCNKPYSGTSAIRDFGVQHIQTGCPIVYTSADSVLQVAAHTDVMPLETLYAKCAEIRQICKGEYGVARVIARPFEGKFPFSRTDDRRDFSLSPPQKTLLDDVKESGMKCLGIGKIGDIFNYQGLTDSIHTHRNCDTLRELLKVAEQDFDGLVFANLIDTDMLYGHRRDVFGYAQTLEDIDKGFGELLSVLNKDDVVYITSDHGNDPCHSRHTDHTREYVPLLISGKNIIPTNLGTISGFDCIADTVREQLELARGQKSLWGKITY